MVKHWIYTQSLASVYPLYVAKAEKKGRTKAEVDEIIYWLTGHTPASLKKELSAETDFETFFKTAPKLNPKRKKIIGVVCGKEPVHYLFPRYNFSIFSCKMK